ncbi:hypothetical protein KV205_26535 [Streptomyces sp. SKN60]|uniref:hypothetical protein n=1 Tax=Streptomyces sp. SKN60 TaxID=2855506 RepID=UPI0022470643|nr:hypothetical protein [Streptomyces sp. SKN60]MCX2184064.1 hypothetical protein [Streptomyces sp. SKN60]
MAVHRHGDLVREWPLQYRDPRVDPVAQPFGETLYLDNWKRSVCGYRVLRSPTAMTVAEDAYDYAAATEPARAAPRSEGHALVLYLYDAENWH